MKKLALSFFIILLSFTTTSQAQQWEMIADKSSLRFDIFVDGSAISGEFKTFSVDITLDPQNPDSGAIRAEIVSDSLSADDRSAAGTALGRGWLFSEKFPRIIYRSRSVKKLDEERYEIDGVLRIKDMEHPLPLPFTLKINGDTAKASGEIKLNRALFKLGDASEADPVILVQIDIEAKHK